MAAILAGYRLLLSFASDWVYVCIMDGCSSALMPARCSGSFSPMQLQLASGMACRHATVCATVNSDR